MANHSFSSNYAKSSFPGQSNLWNTPLLETKHFIVVPSIGAIVEGWLLIAPKEKALCFGAIEPILKIEFLELKERVQLSLTKTYGPVAIFEHGPSQTKSKVGCGVDHAHLHLVPTSTNLVESAKKLAPEVIWESSTGIDSLEYYHSMNLPYLYLEQPEYMPVPIVGTSSTIPSQLFRKTIASANACSESWDWKHNPFFENILRTRVKMTSNLKEGHYAQISA